jgi:hypothetical protein
LIAKPVANNGGVVQMSRPPSLPSPSGINIENFRAHCRFRFKLFFINLAFGGQPQQPQFVYRNPNAAYAAQANAYYPHQPQQQQQQQPTSAAYPSTYPAYRN